MAKRKPEPFTCETRVTGLTDYPGNVKVDAIRQDDAALAAWLHERKLGERVRVTLEVL